jgi:hypothetical protein
MKNVFAALCMCLFASVAFSGEVSVLKTEEAPAVAVAPATVVVAPCAGQCQPEMRAVTLSPWQVRRLNRIADRQETRDARNCCGCCESSCRGTNVLVEARKKPCCGCCK